MKWPLLARIRTNTGTLKNKEHKDALRYGRLSTPTLTKGYPLKYCMGSVRLMIIPMWLNSRPMVRSWLVGLMTNVLWFGRKDRILRHCIPRRK